MAAVLFAGARMLFPVVELAILSFTLLGRVPLVGNVDENYYYPLCALGLLIEYKLPTPPLWTLFLVQLNIGIFLRSRMPTRRLWHVFWVVVAANLLYLNRDMPLGQLLTTAFTIVIFTVLGFNIFT